MDKWKLRLG